MYTFSFVLRWHAADGRAYISQKHTHESTGRQRYKLTNACWSIYHSSSNRSLRIHHSRHNRRRRNNHNRLRNRRNRHRSHLGRNCHRRHRSHLGYPNSGRRSRPGLFRGHRQHHPGPPFGHHHEYHP